MSNLVEESKGTFKFRGVPFQAVLTIFPLKQLKRKIDVSNRIETVETSKSTGSVITEKEFEWHEPKTEFHSQYLTVCAMFNDQPGKFYYLGHLKT